MRHVFFAAVLMALTTHGLGAQAQSIPNELGAQLEGLLSLAKEQNPDYAALRHALVATEARQGPAGALMAPRFKVELQNLSRDGTQNPTLLPARVGATQYTLSQDLPWVGKRALRQDVAAKEVQVAQGQAQLSWADTAARIKTVFAQRFLIHAAQRLVSENLDLMLQLEKVLQVRYATGLAAQQDITRIHVEHTGMRVELAALAGEWRQSQTRLNALLARPLDAPLVAPERLPDLPEPARLGLARLSERLQQFSPALRMESARVASAETVRDLTLKNRFPDFTVGINVMQQRWNTNVWGLMLEMNLPVQGEVLRAQELESQSMLAAAQARREAAANQALADLSANLEALETSRQTSHLMAYSLLPQAELTWRSALAAYENGKADFATLLDAQRQIRQARLGQLKSLVDAHIRLAEIERLTGEDI